jgi:N-acetylglucosamine-6-phosphate deacetylase
MTKPNITTIIEHARIVTEMGIVENGWLVIQHGSILAIGEGTPSADYHNSESLRIDAGGGWLLPGFIDVHVHGGFGHDFMDADAEGLDAITGFHARHGTTTMLATTVTAPKEQLDGVLERVSRYVKQPMPYAQLAGVHLEGPFISAKWPGAQNPKHIVPPCLPWLEEWTAAYPGLVKIQTLAPETEGALPYIAALRRHGIVPASGHTDATYEQLKKAADAGLQHAIHTFNAMRGLHHREPGTVGAVFEDDRITAEVIADGHHVHQACVRLLARIKGAERTVLITDAISAAGLGNGDYELGGLGVVVKDGVARLKDGDSLAGSTLTMIEAFRFAVTRADISVANASRMASGNPARLIGIDGETGSIASGKRADLVLLDADMNLTGVWAAGRQQLEPSVSGHTN